MSNKKKSWNSNNLKVSFSNLDDQDDCQSSSCPEESEVVTPDFSNVESKVCAEVFMMSMNVSQACPHQNISYGINKTNRVSVNDHHALICEETQPSTDRHLPKEILKLLPNRNQQEIAERLVSVQYEKDEIWRRIDREYEINTKKPGIDSQMWREFDRLYQSYLFKTFKSEKTEMKKAMEILEQPSSGGLILNSKNEILAVQNHNGTWSAPKGHRKINKNGELETSWETFLRELFEEMSITLKTMKRTTKIKENNIDDIISINPNIYLQLCVGTKRDKNDRKRMIGLFFVCIDERDLHFELADQKENQGWAWLKIDDILSDNPEPGCDKYYTLRPFVKYLRDHSELLQNH